MTSILDTEPDVMVKRDKASGSVVSSRDVSFLMTSSAAVLTAKGNGEALGVKLITNNKSNISEGRIIPSSASCLGTSSCASSDEDVGAEGGGRLLASDLEGGADAVDEDAESLTVDCGGAIFGDEGVLSLGFVMLRKRLLTDAM